MNKPSTNIKLPAILDCALLASCIVPFEENGWHHIINIGRWKKSDRQTSLQKWECIH